MKIISIIQPWATLMAIREKRLETRSWKTEYRGELGIHASKKIDKAACRQEPFKSILAKHGYDESNLPTGCIIAKGNLSDCLKSLNDDEYCVLSNGEVVEGNEYEFGDYTVGRFAWDMQDVEQIEPVPAKGQLGLWNWEEPKCPTS